MKKNILLLTGTFLLLISFSTCFITLSWFNRFSNDDYEFLKIASELGVLNGIKYFYLNWEGAFFAEFLNISLAFLGNKFAIPPFVFNLTIISCLGISFYSLVKAVLKEFLLINSSLLPFFCVLIVFSDLFYNDLALSEVWFWFIGSSAYLLSLSVLFLATQIFIIKTKQNKKIYFALFLMLLLGGSRLNYSFILLNIISILIVSTYIFPNFLNRNLLLLIFLFLLIGTFIYIIAPGNYIRKSNFKISYALVDIISNTILISLNYIKKFLIQKAFYHLIFILPLFFLFDYIKIKNPIKSSVLNKWVILGALIVVSSIITHSFILYIAKGYQTFRSLPLVNFIVLTYLVFFIFYIYQILKEKFKLYFKYTGFVFLILGSLLLLRRTIINYPIVKNYSEAVDAREALLLNMKSENKKIEVLFLKPLPPSGWLHSSEIGVRSKDPSNNIRLENYYNLPFRIDLDTTKAL